MTYMVVVDDLWKLFRQGERIVKALRGVSLQVAEGEFLALRGSSGSGKSTLLNIIGGLDIPTKGHALIQATEVSGLGANDRGAFRRKFIGFVFQELTLIPHLTALENVALPISFEADRDNEAAEAAIEMLDRCGLADRSGHLPSQLSYGERQRVAVARAAIRKPRLLLADEPTANLDDRNVDRVWEIMRDLKATGTTIISATHDPRLEAHADHVLRIEEGALVDA